MDGLKVFEGSYPAYLEKVDPRSHGILKNKNKNKNPKETEKCMPGGGGTCF